MLVFGLISPHPPLIIPEIGKDDIGHVQTTVRELEQACTDLGQSKPDHLVLISPHEGHGFAVPMHYVAKHLPDDLPVEEILVTEDSYQYYFDLGKAYGDTARKSRERWAIVASGDLSHVLKPDGPYGFDPAGPKLDKAIVAAVRKWDAEALLKLDPKTLESGAECGLRSILFLMGAFEGLKPSVKVRSYEGPFGVGYLVATAQPPKGQRSLVAKPSLTGLARQSIEYYLKTGQYLVAPSKLPVVWKARAGAFVSLHASDGELRGCIGTILPTESDLAEEVIANAVSAAIHDDRFNPVTAAELDSIEISVDVLTEPKAVANKSKLDPKKYGVVVKATDGRMGVLLPDIEGVETVDAQISICREKAGIGPDEPVELRRFQVRRYED